MMIDLAPDFVILLADTSVATTCHEIDHAVGDICKYHGIADDETRGYLAGWVGERVFKYIGK